VHWQESPQAVPVNLRLGDVMPMLSSATGRCFAAFLGHGVGSDQAKVLVEREMTLAKDAGRRDVPTNAKELRALIAETQEHGLGRVNNVLLPGISGFCAPVFDADGHLALGVVSLGSSANFNVAWNGALAKTLLGMTRQLSADLGWSGAAA
jgi:DNA-binding IclR family transcriptional regulator